MKKGWLKEMLALCPEGSAARFETAGRSSLLMGVGPGGGGRCVLTERPADPAGAEIRAWLDANGSPAGSARGGGGGLRRPASGGTAWDVEAGAAGGLLGVLEGLAGLSAEVRFGAPGQGGRA